MPACSLWPYKLVTGLLEKCIGFVNLQTNTVVTSVTNDADCSRVHTSRGVIRTNKVVFATNAYTGGIAPTYAGRIVPYKGSNSHIVSESGAIAPQLTQTYNIAFRSGFTDYLNPRPDGSIIVGGAESAFRTLPNRESWYNNFDDSTLLPNVDDYYNGYMQRNFRGWKHTTEKLWTGIMGQTADALPHVGRVVGKSNHFLMAGFNGGGMTMIYLTARGLARMVKDNVAFSHTGIPACFETTAERLVKAPSATSMTGYV
jgi:glycine/D-amino acid oxidase-like deaminating enzyme